LVIHFTLGVNCWQVNQIINAHSHFFALNFRTEIAFVGFGGERKYLVFVEDSRFQRTKIAATKEEPRHA